MQARYAVEGDREALVAMGEAMVEELTPHLTFDRRRANETVTVALVSRNPTIFVVDDGGQVAGFLLARGYDYAACAGFCVQQDIVYVRPDQRGTRAAACLFAHFVKWARELQPEEVFAGIGWGRRSSAAARWARRFGFEPQGQQSLRLRIGGS